MRIPGFVSAAGLAVLSLLPGTSASPDAADPVADNFSDSSTGSMEDPMLKVHQVILTVQEVGLPPPDTPRHREEKKALMRRMSKKTGTWNGSHPRWRLLTALHGFYRYEERQQADLGKWRGYYAHLQPKQRELLELEVKYSKKFDEISTLIKGNQKLCDAIVANALEFYGVDAAELETYINDKEKGGAYAEVMPTSQGLKHIVRDWALGGMPEREPGFKCVMDMLSALFPQHDQETQPLKVLLPGSGVGRLGHEVAKLGFEVSLNEWSMYMNVIYRFLETHRGRNQQTFNPFIDNWSHHATTADMLREVVFPDQEVNATSVVLIEGDFTTVLADKHGHFDVLLTYFFIDTARNLMAYFDTIKALLRPGGHWVNFGPLLYGSGPFVQLSLDEVIAVVEGMGFEFLEIPESCGVLTFPDKPVRGMESIYGFNDRALTRNAYQAQAWVVRKK